jgi:CTP:molybdopterin cytidylyltransferase MocA
MHLPISMPPCDAILLAAGAGRRLGLPKALLELKGIWMLPRLVSALQTGGCEQVVVVVRAEQLAILEARGGCGAQMVIANPHPDGGRNSSMHCGLAALQPGRAVMIHPCDIPLLSAAAVLQLLQAWAQQTTPQQCVARLMTPGGKGGHPLLLGAEVVPEVLQLRAEESLRSIVHFNRDRLLNVVRRGDPGPFLDVDTREQLELLESLL